MQKRSIISSLLTIVILAITFKYWLIIKPNTICLNLDYKGTENLTITSIFNKKDDNTFHKSFAEVLTLKNNSKTKYSAILHHKTPPKRIKLILTNLVPDKEYCLSDIFINENKYKFDNLNNFSSKNADLKVINNVLIIKPYDKDIVLNCIDKIKILPQLHFDIKIFIIIAILSYLLFYKLTSYLADFKINKNASRIDIIFLIVCTILMFIPMSHINNNEISIQENRTLTKWKPFISNKQINYNFGNDFNEWFSDRFNFRNYLIDISSKINFIFTNDIYRIENRSFSKKTHWAFNAEWIRINDLKKDFPRYKQNIIKLNNLCEQKNIKLYIVIPPTKGEVYSKEFRETTNINNIILNGDNFIKYMHDSKNDYLISPLNELKAEKKDFTYSKGDVHWNEYGGFITYKKLMKRIKKDFPSLSILDEKDFVISESKYSKTDYNNYPTNGNLYKEMNINNKYLDVNYLNFKPKVEYCVNRTPSKNIPEEIITSKSQNTQTVYVIGSSYEECLVDFLAPSFKHIVKRRYNTIGSGKLSIYRYLEEISEIKPDILILVVQSISIDCFSDLFKPEQ